ncbi:MAG: WG repeat-containing protein [Bacteroidota bacterium]
MSRGPIHIGNYLVNDRFIEVFLQVTPTESQYKSKSPFIISYLYDIKNNLKRITPDYIYDRDGAEFNDWGHLWYKGIDGQYGMLDMNGEIIIDNKFSGKPERVDSFYIVSNYYGFKGIFDHNGKQTTTIKYGEIGPLKGGFFKFSHADGKGYGVVNSNNAEIIPPICQDIQLKSDGRFRCKIDNGHFYIDKLGKCLTTNHKVYKEHLRAYRNRNHPR